MQGRQGGLNLQSAVKLWPTASARDWKDTPGMARESPDGKSRKDQLARAVYADLWPTPRAAEAQHHGRVSVNHKGQTDTAEAVNQAQIAVGHPTGSLNPTWVEWLMGFPIGWTDLVLQR
jgi:hypothetical protein